ncbi:MAG: hypothetical protein KAH03_06275 [Cocleimonas sp.]|nr:hypothetical protein [Cocleimonas sp.]
MSISNDVTALVFAAVSFPNKAVFQRTTPELFPFINIEAGAETYASNQGTENRTVGVTVTIIDLDSDYTTIFINCDTLETDLKDVPDLAFTGFSAVNIEFENEVTFLTRELSFTYSKNLCL